ncbi:MAG: arylsulfatase [Planctomycetaceae bacterium]
MLWLLAAIVCGGAAAGELPPRPNVVVILSDDMGFSDIGCYGSEIETPHLDRLAAGGLRFTQCYNTARCCPTRASLLTGLYPHQAGIGHMMDDRGLPGYRGDLNERCVTIAEALRPAGYTSYAVGKWHVTKAVRPKDEAAKRNWPLQRGFSRFYGTITGAGSFFDPSTLVRDNRFISPFADPEYPGEDYYYTDAISDHAVRFIREHDRETPFFLYVAYTAAHWPMHARDRDIAKYAGRYAAGYDAVRAARYAKMLASGVVTSTNTALGLWPSDLGEHGDAAAWDQRNMEVFAAMVDCMDQGIGRIVRALEDTGRVDDTLVCYLQDNGGCAEGVGRDRRAGREAVAPQRAAAPVLPPVAPDVLQTDSTPKQTRDGFPLRQGRGVMVGAGDTYGAYGEAWSTVSNTPFRRHKHWVHEGGISTPLVVHWPRGIARPGRLEHTPCHLIDIMATAIDLGCVRYPEDMTPPEGRSLAPLFTGGVVERDALYWEHEGNRAVREGDWKLVAVHDGPWELYDLSRDRSEQHDLSGAQPDRVRRMEAMWNAYASRTNVAAWADVVAKRGAGPSRQR